MTRLQDLAYQRFTVLGNARFGPYRPGRYSLAKLKRMGEEELADARVYRVLMHRIERADAGAKTRRLVARALELAWRAIELQAEEDALELGLPRPRRAARRRRA